MEYRAVRAVSSLATWAIAAAAFAALVLASASGLGFAAGAAASAVAFVGLFAARRSGFAALDERLRALILGRGPSRLATGFVDKVRTCFTLQEFVAVVRESLEKELDASAVLIQSNTWEVVYASPAAATSDPGLVPALKRNYRELSEGLVFIDDRLGLTLSNSGARGFFVFCKGYYFFVFTRLAPYIDLDVYRVLQAELMIFFDRVLTVTRLFEIAALTKEWRQIAETQKGFLPEMLPEQPKLSLAAYWRPLVNVSGDYYDAIRLDADRTLLVMGDVSGKGLGAALVMGIAINTIRAAADKSDLPALIRSCDQAIRGMGFDDKYTVLFLGLVDVKRKRFTYVNAAMSEQFVVARTVRGPAVKRLESNCGIVGLMPIAGVEPEEIELRTDDVIILSTDGLTELEDAAGVALDESAAFRQLCGDALELSVDELVERLATLGETYVPDRKLRDDITILAAKVGRLWD